jgi:hypothetical protein
MAQTGIVVAPLYPLTKSSKLWIASKTAVAAPIYFSSLQVRNSPPLPVAKSPLRPYDYYQQHFGFFCKQEWNWEKQTLLPVKVRLGSYQEAQRLEGK